LLFRLGGLGDLLVTLPSINLLRTSSPGLALHLVGRKEYGEFLRREGAIEIAHSIDEAKWASLFEDSVAVPREMRRWISGFDLILGWLQPKTETRRFSRILADLGPEAHLMIYDSASRRPISRYFFERTAEAIKAIEPNGRPAPAFEECARLPSSEISPALKFAVVHPGSGSPKKCWPLDRFLEVASFLRRRGFSGTLATGEAEERWEGELRKVALPAGWTWLRRPALPALARLLREATLYLGNDSGVTHLAAACGTNVIAIFRKEFETAWRPFGRTTVLSAENVEQVSLEDAVAAIGRVLSRQGFN
jgi:heptosyltransferase III